MIEHTVLKPSTDTYYVISLICILICATGILYLANIKSTSTAESKPVLQKTTLRRSKCSFVGFEIPKANHLFYYSAVMYVSWLTGRRPCFRTTLRQTRLEKVFDVYIRHFDASMSKCPVVKFDMPGTGIYDRRVKFVVNVNKTKFLLLRGYFQSWKFAEPIASQFRQKLKFRQKITKFVANFLARNVPPGWTTQQFVRVGVHVRRGDFLSRMWTGMGTTTASERYLQRAMRYFVERFPRVQFIVASDDIPWCQKHVKLSVFNKTNVNITLSVRHKAGQDLALLASCDHTVMTTGTFSWWAAWLANGTTVYCANYPRRGSLLSSKIRRSDYYRPGWIGMYN